MFITIIMGITNAIIIFAIYYTATLAVDKKKDRYFGIRINIDGSPEIKRLIARYQKINKQLMICLLIITGLSFLSMKSSYVLLTHFIVLLASLIGGQVIMCKYTMKFDDLIAGDDEIMSKIPVTKTRKVDLYLSNKGEEYQFTSFMYNIIVPVIFCTYLVFKIVKINDINNIEYPFRHLYIIMLIVNIILLIMSIVAKKYIVNMRQLSYVDNADENEVINYRKKNSLINITYVIVNINIVSNSLFVILLVKSVIFSVAISIIISVLTIFLIIYAYKKFKQVDYTGESSLGNWIYGVFYYNKSNDRLLVAKRFGIGSTLNLAKPAGKVITILTVIMLVLIYSSSLYIILGNEIVDHRLMTTKELMHITSINYSKTLPISDIQSVELVKKYDVKFTFKTNGISTESFRRGYFNVEGLGNCFVCVYRSSDTIIKIKTGDGISLYSGKTTEETKRIYRDLMGMGEVINDK